MSQYLKHDAKAWDKIEHIVVLMLENRSFDNLLGWLYDTDEPSPGVYFNGLDEHLFNTLSNIDDDGRPFVEQVYVRRNGEPPERGPYGVTHMDYEESFRVPDPDPGEGFRDTNQQLFGVYDVANVYPPDPTNLGFVDNYKNAMLYGTYSFGDTPTDPRSIMSCYTAEQTPVLSGLAKGFAVCDEWFCSVPSQTWPNRAFAIAATSDGNVNNRPDWVISSPTVFDQLEAGGVGWKVYAGVSYNREEDEPEPFSLTRIMLSPDKATKYAANFVLFQELYDDLKKGTLPAFSFLEPQFSTVRGKEGKLIAKQNDQHPPADIRDGEALIADVYDAIVASDYWKEKKNVLFVITYDEHGGCYDHYGPEKAAAPVPAVFGAGGKPVFETSGTKGKIPAAASSYPLDPLFGFRFNRYGLRVPTVVVSPWVKPGTVARPESYHDAAMMAPGKETSRYFDHTSIIASVRNCFGLKGCLTDRDRYAPDLSGLLTDEAQTQPVKVTASKATDAAVDAESHLMEAISTHLAARTGDPKKEGESTDEHVARAYRTLERSGFKKPLASK